jgi:hypothetical protein
MIQCIDEIEPPRRRLEVVFGFLFLQDRIMFRPLRMFMVNPSELPSRSSSQKKIKQYKNNTIRILLSCK